MEKENIIEKKEIIKQEEKVNKKNIEKNIENNEEKVKIDSLKNYIKNLTKNESCLKSISFSFNEENREFICYFAWQQSLYNQFFVERDIVRKNVISYLNKYNFYLNKKKSSASKYVFNEQK